MIFLFLATDHAAAEHPGLPDQEETTNLNGTSSITPQFETDGSSLPDTPVSHDTPKLDGPASPAEEAGTRPDPVEVDESVNYAFLGDTWANWIGAVTGFAALLVSIRALYLLRGTLRATQDTVQVTREIGQKQVRAYLSIQSFEIKVAFKINLLGKITIKNTGASVARNVRISLHVWQPKLQSPDLDAWVWIELPDIQSGETTEGTDCHHPITITPYIKCENTAIGAYTAFIDTCIFFEDVFGTTCTSFSEFLLHKPYTDDLTNFSSILRIHRDKNHINIEIEKHKIRYIDKYGG